MNITKRCKYGLTIFNRKDIWIGKSFDWYGEYSEAEVELFRRVIPQGSTVYDVGANIGAHTLAFSRIVGQTGSVIALEPERLNFYTLCGNIAVNNIRNTYCFQQAVGADNGIINVPELDYDRTSNFGGLELSKDYSGSAHYPVAKIMIDGIGTMKVDFIKIDIEGMEKDAILGAKQKLAVHKPFLYIEDDRKEHTVELRQLIASLGYKMYVHTPRFFNPNNFYDEPVNQFNDTISLNLFCHHESVPCPNLDGLGLQLVR